MKKLLFVLCLLCLSMVSFVSFAGAGGAVMMGGGPSNMDVALIFDEKFETTTGDGTDEADWVGSGPGIDTNGAAADAGSPSGWGGYCAEIPVTGLLYAYNTVGAESQLWWRTELVVTAEGLANEQNELLFIFYNNSLSAAVMTLVLTQDGSGDLRFALVSDCDGAGGVACYSANTISLDTRYRLEFMWDADNDLWAWKIDGVAQENNVDNTAPITSDGTLSGTHLTDAGAVVIGTTVGTYTYTAYYDKIAASTEGWIGD